jgi:Putative amidoligase enzyme
MRFKQFKQFKPRTLTEADLEQLDELRMNPTTLQQFGASNEAKGIMAGFEAELVFTGLGGEGDYDEDPEPDYDADERCRSIQQVIDFFENDEYGYGTSGRDLDNLQEGLDEKYYEWHDDEMYRAFRDEQEDLIKKVIEEDDFDWGDEIRKQLDMMDLSDSEIKEAIKQGTEAPKFNRSSEQQAYAETHPGYQRYLEAREQAEGLLDDLVQDSISSQDKHYDYALDEFRDGFYIDDDSGFFDDIGMRWMSDVASEFSLMWPVITYTGQSSEGGFDESNAERLADDLHEKLGVKTKVSGGYHSARRDNETWIFEPDSSLDADDSDNMPVEIVSPPMPLEECLAKMQQFFEWAEENGAYANSSTGFHMGVSLPHRGGDVDYVKLALFLGDEHVLREFGRSGNHFCEAAIKKIRGRVKNNKEAVGGAMELMRNNLIELAQKALEINNHGFGKYTSINPQGGNDSTRPDKERGAKYIEFRSAGGSNYFEDIDKLKNTLLRYAQAMTIAANPAAERREYYKKLYKLISPPEGDPAIDLFSRFATGEISSEELKKSWAEKQLEKEPKGDWVLYDSNGKRVQGHTYNGYTKSEALERAKQKLSPGSSMEDFQKAYKFLPSNSESGDWEVYDVNTGETLETLRGYEFRGRAADAVYDKYAGQNIPFNLRPVDSNAPEKPLTPREKLAKNIKQAPAEEIKNWKVYDTKTGEVHYEQEGRKSNLVQAMRKMERENKWPQGRLAIKEIPAKEQEPVDGDDGKQHKWEFYYAPTGRVLDTVDGASIMQARAVLADTQRRYNDLDADQIRMRTVPTDASQERYNDRQELNPVIDQPPAGFATQRPGTGDYYEVKSGDRVYGYLSVGAGQTPGGLGPARAAREYVNDLTGRNDAQLVYKAGDPVQSTAPNGVPLWQIYQRDNGHVIHSFPDHDQTSAWATAQGWLRDHGAEDPSVFSLRPMMSA